MIFPLCLVFAPLCLVMLNQPDYAPYSPHPGRSMSANGDHYGARSLPADTRGAVRTLADMHCDLHVCAPYTRPDAQDLVGDDINGISHTTTGHNSGGRPTGKGPSASFAGGGGPSR